MRQLGWPDVTVNGGKLGKNNADGEPSRKNIKKPRKGEVNYLPDFPEGMDVARLEALRETMVNEMQKKNPNDSLIRKNMDITCALRRDEVVSMSLTSARRCNAGQRSSQKARFVRVPFKCLVFFCVICVISNSA